MKRELIPARQWRRQWRRHLYRILALLILALVILLIAGTVFGLVRSRDAGPLFRLRGSAGADTVQAAGRAAAASANVFTGIGRLRIPLNAAAGANGGTLILSIAFPYPDDRPFTEELAAKIGDFRNIAADYFSALPAEKLAGLDEEAAKAELLRRYNAILRLGKIEALYFSDLNIID